MARFIHGKPLVLAHRCLYPGLPENTLPALKKVIAEGVDLSQLEVEEHPGANIPGLLVQFGLARRCNINISFVGKQSNN